MGGGGSAPDFFLLLKIKINLTAIQLSWIFLNAFKIKVFIQTLQKSQDRHKISLAFALKNKNTRKVFEANLPPPTPLNLDLPPIQLGLK